MKTLQLLFFTFCYFLFSTTCFGQIKSMGFSQKIEESSYFPKLQIINNTLFVCSNTGIYQKDMMKDTDWELYAFENSPVIEFVKNGNNLIAVSMGEWNETDNLILVSNDDGKTYSERKMPYHSEDGKNCFRRIVQNPLNKKTLLIVDERTSGLFRSQDFGNSWTDLSPFGFINPVTFTAYHPLDTTTIFYSGETGFLAGTILKSTDSGITWTEYTVSGGDNCVHQIDFHPTNPNILVFGGEGIIGKSMDKGETWTINKLDQSGMYFYKVLFDKKNPETLYASGIYGSENNKRVYIYRSTDTGENWHLAYRELLDIDCGGIIDMVQYKNRLIFYTREGLFELDLETTPRLSNPKITVVPELTISQNPIDNTLYFNTELNVNRIEIRDVAGRIFQQNTISVNERSIDVSGLATGVYLAVFHTGQQCISKKIFILK